MTSGDRDATAHDVPETTGTKVDSPAAEAYPATEDGTEATGGVRGAHSHSTNAGQPSSGLDGGVDRSTFDRHRRARDRRASTTRRTRRSGRASGPDGSEAT